MINNSNIFIFAEKRERESYLKSDNSAPARGVIIKKELEDKDVAGVSSKLDSLFRDDVSVLIFFIFS